MTRIDGALVKAVKYFRPKPYYVEDLSFSAVHYKFAFGVLLGCCILSGLTSWYSPIECSKLAEFESSFVKQACYSNSTFIVQDQDGAYPGVVNVMAEASYRVTRLYYYQWVTLALLLQAAFFQIPHIIWKSLEGGRIRRMVDCIRPVELGPYEERLPKLDIVAVAFVNRRNRNSRFFVTFAICQVLYLFNIVSQLILTNEFLNGHFLSLVPNFFSDYRSLSFVFPKVSKCSLRNYGPAGDINKHDAICILAMNILNEKIYLTVWVLFAIALLTAVIQVCNVAVYACSESFRVWHIQGDFGDTQDMSALDIDLGDWLILKFLKENLDPIVYDELLEKINTIVAHINK